MKTMPAQYTGAFGKKYDFPVIGAVEFNQRLVEIGGRDLTTEEWARVDRLVAAGWTLRVVASEIFGELPVDAFYLREESGSLGT